MMNLYKQKPITDIYTIKTRQPRFLPAKPMLQLWVRVYPSFALFFYFIFNQYPIRCSNFG
ncbi:MAG: hypothetical protein HC817_05695 [Saprospiraceae bacterium]|nr:hypothetical protein [Saprospiraceae bacterium]